MKKSLFTAVSEEQSSTVSGGDQSVPLSNGLGYISPKGLLTLSVVISANDPNVRAAYDYLQQAEQAGAE